MSIELEAFVELYLREVLLFLAEDDVLAVLEAIRSKVAPDSSTLNRLLDSVLGGALFREEAHKAQWRSFLDHADRWFRTFLSDGLLGDMVSSFVNDMGRQTKQLISTGHTHVTKSVQKLSSNGFPFQCAIQSLDDFWQLPMHCLTSAICINTGHVVRYPWEEALLGDLLFKL